MEQNWRAGFAQDSRNKIVNRIIDTVQRHTTLLGQDGRVELWKIATQFEENIFYAASDQRDYLRKISVEMLNLKKTPPNAPKGALPTGTNQSSVRPLNSDKDLLECVDAFFEQNWRAGLHHDSRSKIVNRIMDTLQRHTPLSGQDGVTELWKIANRFEEKIFYIASDQYDYLRKISLKMLNLEARTQNAPNGALPTSSIGTNQRSVRPLDSGITRVQSRQQVVQPTQDGVVNNGIQRSSGGPTSSFSSINNFPQPAPVMNAFGQVSGNLPALDGNSLSNNSSSRQAPSRRWRSSRLRRSSRLKSKT